MPRTKGVSGKPTGFNKLLMANSLSAVEFAAGMQHALAADNMPVELFSPLNITEIRLLKSGAKDISKCHVFTVQKICYTFNYFGIACTPNDLIPNVLEGKFAKW